MTEQPVVLVMSVDTEEDSWGVTAAAPMLRNIWQLPRLHTFLSDLGVRTTYFVNYPVANDETAAGVLREIATSGRSEIAAHLHTWNTPPFDGPPEKGTTMLLRLPRAEQTAKVASLTQLLTDRFGTPPVSFRAGRFGLGEETAAILAQAGYAVDSSVTPFFSWDRDDDGPSFVGAPLDVYRPSLHDVRAPATDGVAPLIEVPISGGYTRGKVPSWERLYRRLHGGLWGHRVLTSLGARTRLLRHAALSPEQSDLADLIALSRAIVGSGVRILHAFWHSPSLVPGLTPFVKTQRDVTALYRRIADYVAWLTSWTDVRFATVAEAATLLDPATAAKGDPS